jgi:hypothetical protein
MQWRIPKITDRVNQRATLKKIADVTYLSSKRRNVQQSVVKRAEVVNIFNSPAYELNMFSILFHQGSEESDS